MLDVWVRAYRAAAHAIMVVKGDKQEGTRAAAQFDANTVVDILCELMGGRTLTLTSAPLTCCLRLSLSPGRGRLSCIVQPHSALAVPVWVPPRVAPTRWKFDACSARRRPRSAKISAAALAHSERRTRCVWSATGRGRKWRRACKSVDNRWNSRHTRGWCGSRCREAVLGGRHQHTLHVHIHVVQYM